MQRSAVSLSIKAAVETAFVSLLRQWERRTGKRVHADHGAECKAQISTKLQGYVHNMALR
jgi:hypothetical protein